MDVYQNCYVCNSYQSHKKLYERGKKEDGSRTWKVYALICKGCNTLFIIGKTAVRSPNEIKDHLQDLRNRYYDNKTSGNTELLHDIDIEIKAFEWMLKESKD